MVTVSKSTLTVEMLRETLVICCCGVAICKFEAAELWNGKSRNKAGRGRALEAERQPSVTTLWSLRFSHSGGVVAVIKDTRNVRKISYL